MRSSKSKKTIRAAVFSSGELCILDSFAMFKNKHLVDSIKTSTDRISFSIPEYNLIARLQDDNSFNVQFNEGSYIIKVEQKATNLGNAYYFFFHCPECSTRARKLYCIKGRYLCRKCGHLGYYSQKLNFYDRLLYMQAKIKATLKSKGGSLDRKPPWMKRHTFERLKLQEQIYEATYYYAAELEFARQIGGNPPRFEDILTEMRLRTMF
ncbi:hypothetical protein KBC04_02935 [Candidatus Babeliales bacterium]|nr:hypothetical protein [Candidatus Babeliales bacterium]MBP9843992.1 hypothetical protein [Candidatus Babeliales bacterium]